jgi:hypothetical protein
MAGLVLTIHARLAAGRELRHCGYTFRQVRDAMSCVDSDVVDAAAMMAGVVEKVGAIGDGKILQAIIDFFKSPEGQALIKAIVEMLITLLFGL